jgi:methionyl-tRNA formyltransferase
LREALGRIKEMEKRTIKVIKKEDRTRGRKDSAPSPKTKRQATRDAIATVGGWVRDLHEKRRDETRRAFDNLFADPITVGE